MGLVKTIKKLLTDSNSVVAQLAVKVCGNLAKGLREDFEPYCKELISSLLQKFKEKKTSLLEEVNQVLENFLSCCTLEDILSDLVTAISDKAPTVKKNTCLFIERLA